MNRINLSQATVTVMPTYRTSFEESLTTSLKIRGIDTSQELKTKDAVVMKKFMDKGINYDGLLHWIKKYGEKTIIHNLFNGNRYEFNGFIEGLKSLKEDLEKSESGDNQIYVTVDTGKMFHDPQKGDHAPAHATHFNHGLGEDAGWVGMNNMGYVAKLFGDGYLQKVDAKAVKGLVFEWYEIIISDMEAEAVAVDLNRDRRNFEGKMLQGTIGDSKTVKDAISIITNKGKTLGMSYEQTNLMGTEVRKTCSKYDAIAGKIIGKAKTEGDSQELNSKTARFIVNLLEGTAQNTDNVLSLINKMLKSK